MEITLAIVMATLGIVYMTPGALPVAANNQVFLSRIGVGFGFIVAAVALGSGHPGVLLIALAIISAGHSVAAWAIFQQKCAKDE